MISSAKLKGVWLDVEHILHSVSCFINDLIQPLFNILYKHKLCSLITKNGLGPLSKKNVINFRTIVVLCNFSGPNCLSYQTDPFRP